jgi:hypothetical protein
VYLQAYGGIQHPAGHLPDLKDWVADAVGQRPRRISRFMELALIGAGRCARGRELPRNTAVYLTSRHGDMEVIIETMDDAFRRGHPPKPLTFVNTVSNSTAFYVAKCLQLQARSSFVCSRHAGFAAALQLALSDVELGTVLSALVGTVDGAVLPRAAAQSPTEEGLQPAESSHWLWLTHHACERPLARVVDIVHARDAGQLLAKLAGSLSGEVWFRGGLSLAPADGDAIQSALGTKVFAAAAPSAHADSAIAIAEFAARHRAATLLHVDADGLGRLAAVLVDTR